MTIINNEKRNFNIMIEIIGQINIHEKILKRYYIIDFRFNIMKAILSKIVMKLRFNYMISHTCKLLNTIDTIEETTYKDIKVHKIFVDYLDLIKKHIVKGKFKTDANTSNFTTITYLRKANYYFFKNIHYFLVKGVFKFEIQEYLIFFKSIIMMKHRMIKLIENLNKIKDIKTIKTVDVLKHMNVFNEILSTLMIRSKEAVDSYFVKDFPKKLVDFRVTSIMDNYLQELEVILYDECDVYSEFEELYKYLMKLMVE